MGSLSLYIALVFLLLANISLFIWNIIPTVTAQSRDVPALEAGVSGLNLVPPNNRLFYSSRLANASASSCYTLGPYNSERAAQLMMARIRNYGLGVQMRSLRTLETMNYLVYIPPLASRAEAETIVRDMQGFDVQEQLVISEGPYQNAISLGFFDDVKRAMRHAEYIRYLGYDARYTEQKAAREVFWLDYDEPFGSNTPVLVWSASIDPTSRVQLIPRAC